MEHDCYLTRALEDKILDEPAFSFCRTLKNREIAACGYYLSPEGARTLIREVRNKKFINGPVDGYIHFIQEYRYPYGTMKREFIEENIYGVHFINEKIGTVKTPVRKKIKDVTITRY